MPSTIRPMKALRLSPNARLAIVVKTSDAARKSAVKRFSQVRKPVSVSDENDEASDQDGEAREHAPVAGDEPAQRRAREI